MKELLGLVIAGFALAGSPGPATLSLAAAGAAFGARLSIGYLAGIVAGMGAVMAVTAAGVGGMVAAVPGATPVITVLAALYFAYLAYRIATAPPLSDADERRTPPRFVAGLLLSLVNPKGYLAMAAVFSGFVLLPDQPMPDALLKGLVLAAIMVVVNLAWLLGGAALTQRFREPRSNRVINVAFAVLLIGSILLALLL